MALDLASAEKIAQKGLERAREMGLKVSFAVLDESGNLVYVARMDGAPFFSPNIAMGKAWVSSAWRISSGDIEKKAQAAPYFYESVVTASGGRGVIRQGALPIVIDGKVVGAAGVSGGTSVEDEEIVRAGLQAIA
ncbi:MAG TPA: heme-binding protein [Chloroflexota bacterium]|nr:heme-binding protein [Chloroflexota bacterium]